MIVDGKKIAEEITERLREDIKRSGSLPVLVIVYVGDDPVIESFIKIKQSIAEKIGVSVRLLRFPALMPQADIVKEVSAASLDLRVHGVVVQLPLPVSMHAEAVLSAIDPRKDIDVLSPEAFSLFASGRGKLIPPTAAAVAEVLTQANVNLEGKKVVIVGSGVLVGRPVAAWFRLRGIEPTVVTRTTEDIGNILREADIVVSGAGVPHFIKPDMVKQGSVLIDAGTSEQGGKMVGDFDPGCEQVASVFTPVPGGVGPITVVMLFRNLFLALAK